MSKKKGIKFETFVEETLGNIKKDRAVASILTADLLQYIRQSGEHAHESHGLIMSKYMESLQRSNDQLVKLSAIIQKAESAAVKELSSGEKDDIYNMITTDGEVEEDG